MKEKNNWKSIIWSAIITGIITLLTTLGINYFSSKKTSLSYLTQTSISFQKDSLNVRIYNLELVNDGDEIVENINGQIEFDGQHITNYKLTNSPVLNITDTVLNNAYKVQISSLNPTEKVTMSFLISSPNQVDSLPIVDFRAKGLSGQLKNLGDSKEEGLSLVKLLFIAISLAVTLSSTLLTLFRRKKYRLFKNIDDDEQHSDDQNKIIAYLCGVHGLTSEISRYLDNKTEVSYWSEADYFGNISLLNRQDQDNHKRLLVLLDLLNYAQVAKESIGIIYYNIAKVYKAIGDDSKSEEYLLKAKSIIPKRIEKRISIDKLFFP